MAKTDKLDCALDWVRVHVSDDSVLVGGCVRDVLRGCEPKDWDVFVLGSTSIQLKRSLGHAMRPPSKPFERHHALCGETDAPFGKVQILSTGYLHVEDLLYTVDWNVSAFAYDGKLKSLAKIQDVTPGKPLELVAVDNPVHTMKRGFLFAERFEMVFRSADIVTLAEQIIGPAPLERMFPADL